MRRQFWAFLCLAMSSAFSCNQKNQQLVTSPDPKDSIEVAIDTTLVIEDTVVVDEAPHLLLSFERTACYGRCPAYLFQLYDNGDATYEGKRHVGLVGIHLATASRMQIDSLMAMADKIHFFELEDKYPVDATPISDLPNTITHMIFGEKEKQIINNHLAPTELKELEDHIDGLILALNWQPKVE